MTDATDGPVAVTEADREAAAEYYAAKMGGGPQFCAYIRNPNTGNTNSLAQAFARHRVAHQSDARASADQERDVSGTSQCPICGKDTPHYHSPEEQEQHREQEAWVEESWERFRANYLAATPEAPKGEA